MCASPELARQCSLNRSRYHACSPRWDRGQHACHCTAAGVYDKHYRLSCVPRQFRSGACQYGRCALCVHACTCICVSMSMTSYTVCVALHGSTGLFIPVRMIYVVRTARLVIGNMLMVTGRMRGTSSYSGVACRFVYGDTLPLILRDIDRPWYHTHTYTIHTYTHGSEHGGPAW